jgi:hypothetical protein
MSLIARLATAATVLILAHFLWAGPAKADHRHDATLTIAAHAQRAPMKCPSKCRDYGWPSYLLSFPPAGSR